MKRDPMFKRITLVLASFSFLLMACDGTIASPDVDASPAFSVGGIHGEDMVPISGDFTYANTGVPPVICEGAFTAGVVSGPGKASHLGKTTVQFQTESCATDFGTATLAAVGSLTLTGANGDAISAHASVTFDLSDVLAGTSLFGALAFTGSITGGRGRFAGATGSISGSGMNDFSQASGTATFTGTISSVGSLVSGR